MRPAHAGRAHPGPHAPRGCTPTGPAGLLCSPEPLQGRRGTYTCRPMCNTLASVGATWAAGSLPHPLHMLTHAGSERTHKPAWPTAHTALIPPGTPPITCVQAAGALSPHKHAGHLLTALPTQVALQISPAWLKLPSHSAPRVGEAEALGRTGPPLGQAELSGVQHAGPTCCPHSPAAARSAMAGTCSGLRGLQGQLAPLAHRGFGE